MRAVQGERSARALVSGGAPGERQAWGSGAVLRGLCVRACTAPLSRSLGIWSVGDERRCLRAAVCVAATCHVCAHALAS